MKTHHKIIRTFSLLLTFVILAAMAVPFTVNAENKVYNVDSASFTLSLEEDGSAVVYERWKLSFTEGSFTRFYKDICSPPNQLEYIDPDNITILECKINDIPAEPNTGERVDGHYFIDYSSENPTINWYQSASHESVTYEIMYRINNAVKLNEDDKAMVSYRFIGDSFSKTVDRADIGVNLPKPDETATCRINQGKTMGSNDRAFIINEAYNVSGIYKAELTMDASIFSGLGRIIDVNVPERIERAPLEPNDNKTYKDFMIAFIPFLGFFALFFIAVFASIFKSGAVKTVKALLKYQKDHEYFKNVSDQLEYYGLPYTFYLMPLFVEKAKNYPSKLMAVEILDLCRQGRLKLEDDGIRIYDNLGYGQTDTGLAQCDTDFIAFMKEFFNSPDYKSFDSNYISFDNFSTALDDKKNVSKIYRKLMNWKKAYQKAMKKSADYRSACRDKNFRKLRKDIIGWAAASREITPSSNPYDCFCLVKKQERLSLYTVLELICSARTSSSDPSDDDALIAFSSVFANSAFSQYYIAREISAETVHSSSDVGGSGCSSCGGCGGGGGCGGCGGGGAD